MIYKFEDIEIIIPSNKIFPNIYKQKNRKKYVSLQELRNIVLEYSIEYKPHFYDIVLTCENIEIYTNTVWFETLYQHYKDKQFFEDIYNKNGKIDFNTMADFCIFSLYHHQQLNNFKPMKID